MTIATFDQRGRVTLGKQYANRTVIVEDRDGDIVLKPAAVIPERELWLHKNPAAMKMVQRGLEQARQNRFVDGPDLDADAELVDAIPDDD